MDRNTRRAPRETRGSTPPRRAPLLPPSSTRRTIGWIGTLVVGAVVVFALLFAGIGEQTARVPLAVVASIAAGAFAILTLLQAQSLFPGLLVSDSSLVGAPRVALWAVAGETRSELPLGILYPIPLLLAIAALSVVGQLGLRKVALLRPSPLPTRRSQPAP